MMYKVKYVDLPTVFNQLFSTSFKQQTLPNDLLCRNDGRRAMYTLLPPLT